MRLAVTELALVWRLFRADRGHQTKRIGLTVLAIAWGTLSIVLLLSFGEGMKRSFSRGSKGLGEGIVVVKIGLARRVLQRPVGELACFIFNHSTKSEQEAGMRRNCPQMV